MKRKEKKLKLKVKAFPTNVRRPNESSGVGGEKAQNNGDRYCLPPGGYC